MCIFFYNRVIDMAHISSRQLSCFRLLFAVASTLLSCQAFATDRVWIVGGGSSLLHSQAQIEKDVIWEQQVIRRQVPAVQLNTLFNDSKSKEKDVVVWQHPGDTPSSLQPLARIFGAEFQNGNFYYRNTVPGAEGTTKASELVAYLRTQFAQVKANDKALFIFSGHGWQDTADPTGNTLRLWDDTALSANELGKLLANINLHVPTRFVLPQCYSGGFAQMVNMPETHGHKLCGFMSVPGNKIAEGCTTSINVGDYRDYSTYFFSAIDRRTRSGKRLDSNPDLDDNGTITLREAHFYSLVNGESTDAPRSTSEVYLEEWNPWYLRLFTVTPRPDNIYSHLMLMLAAKYKLPSETNELLYNVKALLQETNANTHNLTNQAQILKQKIDSIQKNIRKDVLARWPRAHSPYTNNYRLFMLHDLNTAQNFILQHTNYTRLIQMQEKSLKLNTQILESNRKTAQYEKILHLNLLARRLAKFERFAGTAAQYTYKKIVSCEETSL